MFLWFQSVLIALAVYTLLLAVVKAFDHNQKAVDTLFMVSATSAIAATFTFL